ncbi:hypothetical protein ElyMa_005411700 [Elysia marginata]|uniref:Peptidase M13 C-terminal domain-containing protein n=1 Tax=Elysia marginata TaxID=1093978 RepID=A0AAV4EHQ4_9GAST|nr:hypothetical protein ElyMa_005411700 [Elysia marginata]
MLATLTSMLSGHYSNFDQYQRDQANNVSAPDKHLWLQFYYTLVEVPVLGPSAAVYYEQFMNNASTPSRQQILAFTQKMETQVQMTSYNIVNATRFSSAPEDIAEFKKLNLSELSNRPECDALWEELEDDVFTSFLATPLQCTFTFFGQLVRPEGSRNLTCLGMTFKETFVSLNGSNVVSGTNRPYHLQKTKDSCQEVTTPMISDANRTTRYGLFMLAFPTIAISAMTPS